MTTLYSKTITKYELDRLYDETTRDRKAADKAQWFGLYDSFENGTIDVAVKVEEDNLFVKELLERFEFVPAKRKT